MSTHLTCERCGYTSEVTLTTPDGAEMTGQEYAALSHAAGETVVCTTCANDNHES